MSDNKLPVYYDCGICGHFHPIAWNGDCRDDANRFTHDDLETKHGGSVDEAWLLVEPCQHCGDVGPDIDGDCGCREKHPQYEGERKPGMIESLSEIADGSDLGEFTAAYMETALWSSNDESDPETGGDPMDDNYGPEDFAPEAVEKMRADCKAFWEAHGHLIHEETCLKYGPDFGPIGHAGHDFWLTRNGHGAGFWDGDWHESVEDKLTKAAKAFGECNLLVGDDGLIYIM
jgi:hypothetical protein